MNRLHLAQVTLCAVDTRSPALAAQALLRSMALCEFGRVLLFTHGWQPEVILPGVEIIEIPAIQSGADYSRFVLRQLPQHVRSSHALITQWDGFVVDPAAWSDDFLAYDYVGAPWHDQPEARSVGNGGFSLRSRRFLQAGTDLRIEQEHPEDAMMCRHYRGFLEEVHGIRFAPAALARRFAYENIRPRAPSFGFHGPYNLPAVLDEAAMHEVIGRMPDEFFRSRDARRMARSLIRHGMLLLAREVLQRRLRMGRSEPATRLLLVAVALALPWQRGP